MLPMQARRTFRKYITNILQNFRNKWTPHPVHLIHLVLDNLDINVTR